MTTWAHIAGGTMLLWVPIFTLVAVGQEDLDEGVKASAVMVAGVAGLAGYFWLAAWLLLR